MRLYLAIAVVVLAYFLTACASTTCPPWGCLRPDLGAEQWRDRVGQAWDLERSPKPFHPKASDRVPAVVQSIKE